MADLRAGEGNLFPAGHILHGRGFLQQIQHAVACRKGVLQRAAQIGQRHKAAPGHGDVHTPEHLTVRGIGKAEVFAADVPFFGHRFAALLRLGQVQQTENLFGRRHAVHGNVEEAAQLAHGDKEIRRQQQNQQTAAQPHRAGAEAGQRHDHARRRAAVGHQIHDGDGVELHGEHLHGDAAELLGLLVHLLILKPVGPVDFEGGQPLQIFQKGIAQSGVLGPVAAEQLFGPGLHRRDGDGDEGYTNQQHQRRRHIHKAEHHEEGERRQQGVKELGQIGAKVGFQLVHAFHRHLNHLRAAHLVPVGSAQTEEFFVDGLAQRALDGPAGEKAHAGCPQMAPKPHRHRRQRHNGCERQVRRGAPAKIQPFQQAAEGGHHGNVRRQGAPLHRHIGHYVPFAVRYGADQSFVNHHGGLLLSRLRRTV